MHAVLILEVSDGEVDGERHQRRDRHYSGEWEKDTLSCCFLCECGYLTALESRSQLPQGREWVQHHLSCIKHE